MFRAAFLRKVPLFIRNFTENVLLCLAAAAIESTANRFLQRLKLTWRSKLTARVHQQYFSQMVTCPALPWNVLHVNGVDAASSTSRCSGGQWESMEHPGWA